MEKTVDYFDCFPIYGYENGVLISKEKGCITVPLAIELPEVYSLDKGDYLRLNELYNNIISNLGENILLHYQNYFLEETYVPFSKRLEGDFMERGNEAHFNERKYNRLHSYLFISKVPKGYMTHKSSRVNSFLTKKRSVYTDKIIPTDYLSKEEMLDFYAKVEGVSRLINDSELVKASLMDYDDLFSENGLYSKYMNLSSDKGDQMKDVSFENNTTYVGEKRVQFFTVENLDQFEKDYIGKHEYFSKFSTDRGLFPIGNLFSLGFKIPYEHIINQYIYIPESEKVFKSLRNKAKKFNQFSGKKRDDNNAIYADQIYDFNKEVIEKHKAVVYFHMNVQAFTDKEEDFRTMKSSIDSGFRKLKIRQKENNIDRKNLYLAAFPGNSIGISSDLYMPMSSDMASSFIYSEGEFKDKTYTTEGVRMVDRIQGRPLAVSVYKVPEEKSWIFNRGMLVASGSGGGKSFIVNHYLSSELRQGAEALIMEDGNSYDKLCRVFGGVILEHDDTNPFTFNPFTLDSYDYRIDEKGKKIITEDKIVRLVSLLTLVSGGSDKDGAGQINWEVKKTVLEYMITGYYDHMATTKNTNFRFDTFFEFVRTQMDVFLKEKNIPENVFNKNVFMFLLEKFYKGGPRENLLNNIDPRLSDLANVKVVYFKLHGLIENEMLFPITSIMMMEIFNKKLNDESKRAINKIMISDEAWGVLAKPELENYFNAQSRTARKMGGQPIFISQKVDDFTASEVIKNAIVVNSHIKVFLDMRDFIESFMDIQEMMGLTDKQKEKILSLNNDLPEDRKLREVAICWKDKVKVYGVETSLEEKCIYETNPNETKKINGLLAENFQNWELTAKSYANK